MKKRILIVDDEPLSVEPMTMLFEEEGYEVKTMNTHKGIFTEIDEFLPDIILLDVFLHDNDGRYICNLLKSMGKTEHMPIVLISGVVDEETILNDDVSPDGFLQKPFDLEKCVTMVKSLVN
ncbi:MAG: response regulator [Pedobacter sp.]|nr:MAG: response regulator [Pedobacter sp.]